MEGAAAPESSHRQVALAFARAVALPAVLILANGCTPVESGVRHGTPITHVQADYGMPDVISDRSGDLERFYVPAHRPESEWPWDAPRTYYLDRNLPITFVRGRAVRATAIDAEARELMLLPLVRRQAVANDGLAAPPPTVSK